MNRNPRRINRINRALVRTAAIVSISALGAAGGVAIARADTVLAAEGLMQRPGKTATAFGGAFCQHGCRSVNNPTGLLTGFTNQARGADRIEAEVAAALVDPTTGTVTVIGWSLGAASIDTTEDRWQANPESAPAPGRVRLVTFGRPNDRDDDRQTAAPEFRIERLDVVMQYDKIADKPDRFGIYSWLNSAMAGSRHFDYFAADINDPSNLVYRDGQTTHMLIEADVLPMLRWRDWFTPDDRMAELDARGAVRHLGWTDRPRASATALGRPRWQGSARVPAQRTRDRLPMQRLRPVPEEASMSRNLLRGTLFCSSFSLAFYALIALFWSVEVAVALVIPAALLWLVAGFIDRVDDDCGYAETVYGEES